MAEQAGAGGPLLPIENRLCPGCKQSAVNESGGLVVAFGQSFFHVDCFKCAKCNNKVTADTNLLLLSDGSPICAECSYNCNLCHQPILDEAIMTGDDSYHAHCFKCKVCRNRIDELVFAKTSHGIYCMTCHNERMTKIRRHAQRKREKERAAAGGTSSSTRDRETREASGENSAPDRPQALSPPGSVRSKASVSGFRDTPSMRSLNASMLQASSISTRNTRSASPIDDLSSGVPLNVAVNSQRDTPRQSESSQSSGQSQAFQMTVAPPDSSHHDIDRSTPLNGDTASTPVNGHGQGDSPVTQSASTEASGGSHLTPNSATGGIGLQRRKSYDDGTRPLNVLFGKKGADHDTKDGVDKPSGRGLSVPGLPSRTDQRRSINHAHTFDYKNPPPSSFHTTPSEMVRSQTLPVRTDSPVPPSPSKSTFELPRRSSNSSSLRDNSSGSTIYHSPSTSPAPPETGRATPDPSARARSASHDPYSAASQPVPLSNRPATPLRLTPRPIVTLERPPQRSDSLSNIASVSEGHGTHTMDGRLSPVGPGFRQPLHLDNSRSERSSPLGWNGDRSGMTTPTSPSHRIDVPHGVESGTDTEAEGSNGRKSDEDVVSPTFPPPRLPPKETRLHALAEGLKLDIDPDVTAISHLDNSDESSPVERTSISTFIAPALPPIRFSMSGADFSDFLKSVGGIPSLKSLDEIAQAEEPEQKSPRSVNTLLPQTYVENPASDTNEASAPGDANSSDDSTSAVQDSEAIDTVPHMMLQFSSRGRAASESQSPYGQSASKREWLDSNASLNIVPSTARATSTVTTSNSTPPVTSDANELVVRRLQEVLTDAIGRGSQQLKFDKGFVEAILTSLEQRSEEFGELKEKYLGTKRASEQYITGLTVAQQEYDRELVARRNAEAEIIRLRVLLSGQAAKLTALSGETNRREARRQFTEDLNKNLDQLERDVSKLKAERDVTLAEVEELCSSKSAPNNVTSGEVSAAQLSRSLTMRLDNIKKQYQHDLIPLTRQRDTIIREIAELKATREQLLEETTVLNARNEELAQLSAQYARRTEAGSETPTLEALSPAKDERMIQDIHDKRSVSFDRSRSTLDMPSAVQPSTSTGSTSTSTLVDDREIKVIRVPKPEFTDAVSTLKHGIFKWPGNRRDQTTRGKSNMEHHFQPASAIRFTRCDHCGEKLWGGSHFRCTTCHINVHSRCVQQVGLACSPHRVDVNGIVQPPPSIFGRELVEQVKSDLRWGDRKVPVIVEKCIEAVETLALDFEGIYRKTGGAGQTKIISQLFDRGDYAGFDLMDTDRFNDICSVTSVLKTYFRSLPVPLLTFDLHEEFIAAAGLKDLAVKTERLQELVDRLPSEHYHTLRLLVLHLHRVQEHSDANLMNARNLGVVFGPTLMWSRDPGSEFSDMAGKALMVEWLVENATSIF